MEIIYEAYNFFKTNGFVHLPHIIAINHDIDIEDLYYFYQKEKDNKELINFMNHYQNEYGLKTTTEKIGGITYKIGIISNGECIICYEENNVGLKTPCNHFMCMECCVKLFGDDQTVKKCPYCREEVVLYKMNEIVRKLRKDEDVQVDYQFDYQDQIVPTDFTNSFIRGRLVEDDEDVQVHYQFDYQDQSVPTNFTNSFIRETLVEDDDELSCPFLQEDIYISSTRLSLIEHYMNGNEFISPLYERITDIHHVDPYAISLRQRERLVYTNMMGRRNDYPTRSQFDDNIQQSERQQQSRGNLPRTNNINIITPRNYSNTNNFSRYLQATRRQNSRSEINNNNTRRNIPRNGRR